MAAQAELDPYAVCPCGSGKKLKFCCHEIAPDMLRVLRLVEDGQSKPALRQLEPLEKKAATNAVSLAWVLTTKASLLVNEDRAPEAEPALRKVLESAPNNPAALSLLALLRLRSAGRKEAWNLVNRVCGLDKLTVMPPSLPTVLLEVATSFMEESQYLAARHFLDLANIASGQMQEIADLLMALCSRADLPYPLRGNYSFRKFEATGAPLTPLEEAQELASRGAVGKAAGLLQKFVTESPPQGIAGAPIWYNLGLCRAWSAEIEQAVECFRKSAELESDFDTAVETEALAQILSHYYLEPAIETWRTEISIGSPARLLTLLDNEQKFTRQPTPQVDPNDPNRPPVAVYSITDRPRLSADETPTLANAPRVVGNLSIYDAEPDVPGDQPTAILAVAGKVFSNATLKTLQDLAGAELTGEPKTSPGPQSPAIFEAFLQEYLLPPKTNLRGQLTFAKGVWQELVDTTWPQLPLPGLGGKTPQQAATDPSLKRALAAAVIVLQSLCESRGYILEVEPIRKSLGVPDPAPFQIDQETRVPLLSLFQIGRLPLKQLTDNQLLSLLQFLSIWRINGLMHESLLERLTRPGMQQELPKDKTCLFLAKIARSRLAPEESLTWLARAREEATARKAPLHEQFAVDLQELVERGDTDRKDPALPALANQIWTRYAMKVAQLRPTLVQLLTELEIPGPWQLGEAAAIEGGRFAPVAESGSGLWTPGGAEPVSGSGAEPGVSKLWLPGQ